MSTQVRNRQAVGVKKPAKQANAKLSNAALRDVAFVLYSLFRVGSLSATEILKEAGDLLPQHRTTLHEGARSILMRGTTFTEAVSGLFPPTILTVVRAGDEAGSLDKVFYQIWQTSKTQVEIEKLLGKLRMPAVIAGFGLVIVLAFMCFLIPNIYSSFANTAPPNYKPSAVITWSLAANEIVTTNPMGIAFGVLVFIISIIVLFNNDSVKASLGNQLVKAAIRFPGLGRAYANLRFGVVAKYIEIVSAAGLDSNRRIDLVLDVLPGPMRRGLVAFRSEMFTKGISAAATSEGRAPTDPRTSEVLWPRYFQLAFAQANEGDWETPMREFGGVMIEDGKENIAKQIQSLQIVSLIIVGICVMVPMSILYITVGEMMSLSMSKLG